MKLYIKIISVFLSLVLLTGLCACESGPQSTVNNNVSQNVNNQTQQTDKTQDNEKDTQDNVDTSVNNDNEIKNLIIIIGDGMGFEHVAAGQLFYDKQYQFTSWKYTSSNTDSLKKEDGTWGVITDSAAGGTALATGVITVNSYVGKGRNGEDLETILDLGKAKGKSVGIVTSDTLFGATPASFSAHSNDRTESVNITTSQIDSGVDFLLGLNQSAHYVGFENQIKEKGYYHSYSIDDREAILAADKAFLTVNIENGAKDETTLAESSRLAVDFLSKDEDGFVLMIEQAYIDKCSHSNDFKGMVEKMDSLAQTVDMLVEWIGDRNDTAIIITADHETGGLAISTERDSGQRFKCKKDYMFVTWSTTGHTDSKVGVYVYGFDPDFSKFETYKMHQVIKNRDVFVMMKDILENKY